MNQAEFDHVLTDKWPSQAMTVKIHNPWYTNLKLCFMRDYDILWLGSSELSISKPRIQKFIKECWSIPKCSGRCAKRFQCNTVNNISGKKCYWHGGSLRYIDNKYLRQIFLSISLYFFWLYQKHIEENSLIFPASKCVPL